MIIQCTCETNFSRPFPLIFDHSLTYNNGKKKSCSQLFAMQYFIGLLYSKYKTSIHLDNSHLCKKKIIYSLHPSCKMHVNIYLSYILSLYHNIDFNLLNNTFPFNRKRQVSPMSFSLLISHYHFIHTKKK